MFGHATRILSSPDFNLEERMELAKNTFTLLVVEPSPLLIAGNAAPLSAELSKDLHPYFKSKGVRLDLKVVHRHSGAKELFQEHSDALIVGGMHIPTITDEGEGSGYSLAIEYGKIRMGLFKDGSYYARAQKTAALRLQKKEGMTSPKNVVVCLQTPEEAAYLQSIERTKLRLIRSNVSVNAIYFSGSSAITIVERYAGLLSHLEGVFPGFDPRNTAAQMGRKEAKTMPNHYSLRGERLKYA